MKLEPLLYLARVQHFDPVATWLEEVVERDRFQELRWWSQDELASTHDELSPRDLPDLVRQFLLLRAGEAVRRVPTKLMAGARRSTREPGESDPIDDLSVARGSVA